MLYGAPPAAAEHVLVVEEDALLRPTLCGYLQAQGWFATGIESASALSACVAQWRPDVIVLGSTPAGGAAVQACRWLRAHDGELPIILLAERDDASARADGLAAGADECFAKPVPMRVIAASARALLRRRGAQRTAPPEAPGCRIGAFTFVPQTRSLHGGGLVRALTDVEYAVMLALVRQPGEPLAREHLLQGAGARGAGLRPRAIDTAVMRLRRLIEPDPAEPRYLQTVRGRGYMFVPAVARL